ncbi:MAG: cytochrome-c peroxidase [Saprospiraceae bacterium]|nr:cytochrome-c peroxidase [Saprospiraceae bacterium]
MKKVFFLFVLVALSACKKDDTTTELTFVKPVHFPEPTYKFENNRITRAGFELGRILFYDGDLSRDGSISCGSCHLQSAAFTHHGHDVSHGIDDRIGSRNAPPVMNLAWGKTFFWDGGVHDLDLFAIAPIENPLEMDETFANVVSKLKKKAVYPPLFQKAFGTTEISGPLVLKALSQFQLMLVSAESRYDKFRLGDTNALTADEKTGLELVKTKCGNCHAGELFTDDSFRNNGIQHFGDKGRFRITLNDDDAYKFKVPSLRNLQYTAPYMHDGRFLTLDAVVEHYRKGVRQSPNIDPSVSNGISITDDEKQKILTFLSALNDENFIRNKEFSEQ